MDWRERSWELVVFTVSWVIAIGALICLGVWLWWELRKISRHATPVKQVSVKDPCMGAEI